MLTGTKVADFHGLMTEDEKTVFNIQMQCMADELREMRMRMERAERRIQMLTDSFVVSGLWRASSSLESWTECLNKGGGGDEMKTD